MWSNDFSSPVKTIETQSNLTDGRIDLTDERIDLTDGRIDLTNERIDLTDERIDLTGGTCMIVFVQYYSFPVYDSVVHVITLSD